MPERDPVDALVARLRAIADRDLDDRSLTPGEAQAVLDLAARLEAAEAALRRIDNRYCLHSKGVDQAESACLHKPSDQWCSVCIARAALRAEDTPDA